MERLIIIKWGTNTPYRHRKPIKLNGLPEW